jgi:hypothetical protein
VENQNILNVDDYSSTLYRWSYDYHNSVNDLIDAQPGLQMFAVKYNSACLAYELIIKSHIAYSNHSLDFYELGHLMAKKYGHNLIRLTNYAKNKVGIVISGETMEAIRYINQYYSKHTFRYPPYEPRKLSLDHNKLMNAINLLRRLTAGLLVIVHVDTNGYVIS